MLLLHTLALIACALGDSSIDTINHNEAAIQSRIANLTLEASARLGLTEDNMGRYPLEVHVVNFDACSRVLPNSQDFYKGMIVNSWGYRNKISGSYYDDYTAVSLGKMEGSDYRSSGSSLSTKKKDLHTWEWIRFPDNYDVRQRSTELDFYVYNGLPIIYLPLMSWEDAPELRYRYAYMLRVVPEPSGLYNSVYYLKNRTDKLQGQNEMEVHKYTIDFQTLYKKIWFFRAADLSDGFKYYGKVKSVKATTKVDFGGDRNQYSLVPTREGRSSEYLCGFATVSEINFAEWYINMEKLIPYM